jgi:hypothetical protein
VLDDESASDELDVYGQPLPSGACVKPAMIWAFDLGVELLYSSSSMLKGQLVMSMSAVGATIFDLKVLCASSRGVNPAAD